MRPKKHLGQHFLSDQATAAKIVNSIFFSPSLNLVEIGPGKGVLTKYLLQKEDLNLILVEIDAELSDLLIANFPQCASMLVRKDILKLDLADLFGGACLSVIGNFPYNISSQILFKILDERNYVDEVVGMFQREVANRITSPPGSREYGILSVLLQAYFQCEYLFTVKEGLFFPPPRVKSAVIRLKRKSGFEGDHPYPKFKNLVKMAFNQRRKQLKNSLKPVIPPGFSHDFLSLRPEVLSWEDFLLLFREMALL